VQEEKRTWGRSKSFWQKEHNSINGVRDEKQTEERNYVALLEAIHFYSTRIYIKNMQIMDRQTQLQLQILFSNKCCNVLCGQAKGDIVWMWVMTHLSIWSINAWFKKSFPWHWTVQWGNFLPSKSSSNTQFFNNFKYYTCHKKYARIYDMTSLHKNTDLSSSSRII
jgi:hypothetical protein